MNYNSGNSNYNGNNSSLNYINQPEIFSILKADKETLEMFNCLRKNELITLIHFNIFNNFSPIWSSISGTDNSNRDNIFNSYTKITRIYKKIKNKGKIKQNNKSN